MIEENDGGARQSIAKDDLPLVVGVDLGGTQLRAAVLRGATLISRVGLLTGEILYQIVSFHVCFRRCGKL